MKTKLFFILLTGIFYVSIYGQPFNPITITDTADGASSVFAADFNGDTFMDVVAASRYDNTIAWWENDGSGNFTTEHVITTTSEIAISVSAADFDGDDDMDVVAASYGDNTIAWWENDGFGNFSTEHEIITTAEGATHVFVADINGDPFMDVVTAYTLDDTVAWWENDGSGNFTEHIISTNALGANCIYADDLDGDNDIDVLSASMDDGKVVWYENDGSGNFVTKPAIITDPDGAWVVSAADINDDGFVDVIANIGDSTTVWCENDGLGNFVVHTISTNSVAADLCPYDMGEDGDMDIISAEFSAHKLAYFENNDGQGGSWSTVWLSYEAGWKNPHSVQVASINGSGGLDLISAWWGSDHIAWHTNTIGLDEYILSDFSVYPIPTTGMLTIQADFTIAQIDIHNLLGQLVISNTDQNTIDISSASQGLYFLRIMDKNGNMGVQKIVKR